MESAHGDGGATAGDDARAGADHVWQGHELVTLPVETQQEVYARSRAARAAKANRPPKAIRRRR